MFLVVLVCVVSSSIVVPVLHGDLLCASLLGKWYLFCDCISSSHVDCANICVMELWTLSKKLYYICLRKCVHTVVYKKCFLPKLLEADVCGVQKGWCVICWNGTGVWMKCSLLTSRHFWIWQMSEWWMPTMVCSVLWWLHMTLSLEHFVLQNFLVFMWMVSVWQKKRQDWLMCGACACACACACVHLALYLQPQIVMNVSDCYSLKFAGLLHNYLNIAWMSSAVLPFCCAVIRCEVVLGFLHLALSFEWVHAFWLHSEDVCRYPLLTFIFRHSVYMIFAVLRALNM